MQQEINWRKEVSGLWKVNLSGCTVHYDIVRRDKMKVL